MVFSRTNFLIASYVIYSGVSIIIAVCFRKKLLAAPIRFRILYVMLVAFIIRAFAVYFLNLLQQGDYANYLNVAHKIYTNQLGHPLYYGIFPHALNYPIFLSSIYEIVGELTSLPRVINLVFGVIEAGLAAFVMEKTIKPAVGILSGLVVALNPSIIVFTLLSGGEPIYASLTMVSLLFFVLSNSSTRMKSYIYLLLSAAFCAIANFFRPTAVILVIAIVLQLLIKSHNDFKGRVAKTAMILLVFIVMSQIADPITSSVSGYAKPKDSYGWNLYVGANEASLGKWNAQDAAVFNNIIRINTNPSEIQSFFADRGIERYKEMGFNAVPHFFGKLSIWSDEKFTTEVVTQWQSIYTRFKSGDLQKTYDLLINFYNMVIIAGTLIALAYMALTLDAPDGVYTLSFYLIGSILLFMILESSSRYKGAYYSELSVMAVYGYYRVLPKVKRLVEKALKPDAGAIRLPAFRNMAGCEDNRCNNDRPGILQNAYTQEINYRSDGKGDGELPHWTE